MKLTYNHTMKCCFLAYITSAIINNILPLLFLTLQKDFGISISQLGFVVSCNFGVQMVVDFLGAKYADKFGYRSTIIAGLSISAIGLCALATLPFVMEPYIGLLCSVCIYAIGSGIIEVIVSPLAEALPSDNKEAAMSLLHSFYCWGHLFCILFSTGYFVIFGVKNWRYLIYMWAIIPFITALLFTKMPICTLQSHNGKNESVLSLFKQKSFILFFLIMICSGAAEQAMAQWVSYFAEEGLGVSKTLGDLLGTSLFALCMGIARVFYSKKAERLDLGKYLIFCSALCVISFVGAAMLKNPLLALMCCGVCGISTGIMWPGTLSLASQKSPKKSTAMFAMLAVGGDIGCTIGPEAVATGSSFLNIHGSAIKGGLFCAIIFPILLAWCVNKIAKQ